MTPEERKDLIVLAADPSMQVALKQILMRHQSLGIRETSYYVVSHPDRDPGVFQGAHLFLRAQRRNYHHALAVCDRLGCGKEALPREQLETIIEGKLSNDWDDRAAAIVIDPELENWLWTDSPHVAQAIGWTSGMPDLRAWLQKEGLLVEGQAKPADPKAALERAWRRTKERRSSSLYESLASKVSLRSCTDPAFRKLTKTLQDWFPPPPSLGVYSM